MSPQLRGTNCTRATWHHKPHPCPGCQHRLVLSPMSSPVPLPTPHPRPCPCAHLRHSTVSTASTGSPQERFQAWVRSMRVFQLSLVSLLRLTQISPSWSLPDSMHATQCSRCLSQPPQLNRPRPTIIPICCDEPALGACVQLEWLNDMYIDLPSQFLPLAAGRKKKVCDVLINMSFTDGNTDVIIGTPCSDISF